MEEFRGIIEAKPSDKFILDVRDSEEAESGNLIGAKNIASQVVVKMLSEIRSIRTEIREFEGMKS